MVSCENVTFLILRNTFIISDYLRIFSKFSFSKMFFNKIEIFSVFDWLQPCTGYGQSDHFVWFFRIPTLRLLSSLIGPTGLLIRSPLIGPFDDNRSHDVIGFPILSLTYTAESVNIRFWLLTTIVYIYNFFVYVFFDGCGENIKYKDFALNNRQSVFGN